MSGWIYLLRPVRVGMLDTPTDDELVVLRAHLARLQRLGEAGTVVLAGPSRIGDDSFGLVVLDVEDEREARKLMATDPAIVGGVMTAELRPMRFSVRGAPKEP
jgi:uncharacterized protein YciI